jgi:hypothetical protein
MHSNRVVTYFGSVICVPSTVITIIIGLLYFKQNRKFHCRALEKLNTRIRICSAAKVGANVFDAKT